MLVFNEDIQTSLDNVVAMDVDWKLVNIVSNSLRELLRSLHCQRVHVVKQFL